MSSHPACPGFPDSPGLRGDVIDAYRLLQNELGYFIYTWGNISIRLDDGILLTPSKVPLADLTADSLVVIDTAGNKVRGGNNPTSEAEVHRLLLLRRPEFGAMVHSHSPYATAVACTGRGMPVISDEMAEVVGGPINCSPYVPAGHHHELAQNTSDAIGDDAFAVLMGNHGVAAAGRTLEEAVVASRIVGRSAMSYLLSQSIGGPQPIPEALWREEHMRYFYKYGTPSDQHGTASDHATGGTEGADND